jgi:hypothetical protein
MIDTPAIDLGTLLQLVGKLDDSDDPNSASQRFRKYLGENVRDSTVLRQYVDACLESSGDQFDKALQDLVNHTGHLLGFEVEYGRYQGVQGQIGHDGLWKSPKGKYVIVEVKTSDVFTVRTDKLLGYINGLISEQKISDANSALGLYIYGRPTAATTQLEDAIVAQKRQNELRVVGAASLLNLLELVQEYDLDHGTVLDLLLPYHVRVDHLVDLVYDIVSQEKAQPVERQIVSAVAKSEVASGDEAEVAHYLLPANDSEDGTPVEKNLHRWLDKGLWGLGQRTPYRKEFKAGDKICFYAAHIRGVVAIAEFASGSYDLSAKDNPGKAEVLYGIRLRNVKWLKKPIELTQDRRGRLSHFQERDLSRGWAWYVQGTKRLTPEDFAILTDER